MTTYYHTPIVTGESNSPATINTRLSSLDAATKVAYDRAGDIIAASGTSDSEVVDARDAGNTDGVTATVLRERLAFAAADMYNVKAYGAGGTGLTDDLAAIQAAIDSANAIGGGVVFFPRGTYVVSDFIVLKSNVTLQGIHGKSTIRAERAAVGRMMRTTATADNIALIDMRFDRSHANTDHAVELRGGDNVYVKGCVFYGESGVSGGAGALTLSAYTSAFAPTTNARIVDCFFQEAGNYGVQMGDVSNVVVANNVFLDCYREEVGVEPFTGQTATSVSITGNVITMTTNTVTNGTATGHIIVTQASGGVVEDVTVNGNTVREVGSPTNGHWGINVQGGSNVAVIGNTISGTKEYGIHIIEQDTTENITVMGNTLRDCAPTGSAMRASNVDSIIISNNVITGSAAGINNTNGLGLIADNYISSTASFSGSVGVALFRGNYHSSRTDYRNDMTPHMTQVAQYVTKDVTGANTPIYALTNWRAAAANYCGLIHVIARTGTSDSGNVGTYLLHLINTGAGDACQLIDARGVITGGAADHPSFTWTLDSANHHLEATPIGATTGTFHFYATVIGDMLLAAA